MKTATAVFMPYVCTIVSSSEVGIKVAFATFILEPVTKSIIDIFRRIPPTRFELVSPDPKSCMIDRYTTGVICGNSIGNGV